MKRMDPQTYRKMSVPFETRAEANAALLAFQDELYDLRLKHRIKELVFVAEINIQYGPDDERPAIVSGGYGDMLRRPQLLGYALGQAEIESRIAISEYTAHGRKSAKASIEEDEG